MKDNQIIIKEYIIKEDSGRPWDIYQNLVKLSTEKLASIGMWYGGSYDQGAFDPPISYYYHNEGLLMSIRGGWPSPFHSPPVVIVGNDLDKILIGKSTLENIGKVILEELVK